MKNRLLLCLLATGAMVPAAGYAQGESSLALYGSYWDTEDADDTWGAGATWRWGVLELRGTYYEDVTSDRDGLDIEVEDIPIEAGAAWSFAPESNFNPYISGGVSYHILDTNVGDIDDEFGWYGVLGG